MPYIDRRTKIILISLWAITAIVFVMALFSPKEKVTLLEYMRIQSMSETAKEHYSSVPYLIGKEEADKLKNPPTLSSILWDLKWWIALLVMFIVSALYTYIIEKNIRALIKLKGQMW
jgi:hypothetical protein